MRFVRDCDAALGDVSGVESKFAAPNTFDESLVVETIIDPVEREPITMARSTRVPPIRQVLPDASKKAAALAVENVILAGRQRAVKRYLDLVRIIHIGSAVSTERRNRSEAGYE